MSTAGERRCVVVMGVSGVGKTAVARGVAERLDLPWIDSDDLHPPKNVAKMARGTPLDDADRQPWLEAVGTWLRERSNAGSGGVVACSALTRNYRDVLRRSAVGVVFVHLTAEPVVIAHRIAQRIGHFMPASLLKSQLALLEPLGPDEIGAPVDAGQDLTEVVDAAVRLLRDVGRGERES